MNKRLASVFLYYGLGALLCFSITLVLPHNAVLVLAAAHGDDEYEEDDDDDSNPYYDSSDEEEEEEPWEDKGNSLGLTNETFYEQTAGKAVLVKFFARGETQSLAMRTPWGKLSDIIATRQQQEETKDNDADGGVYQYRPSYRSILIAEVDCWNRTSAALCQQFGITKLPTVLYGDVSDLQTYEGDTKDTDALVDFVQDHLWKQQPFCGIASPAHLDACAPERRQRIDQYLAMTVAHIMELVEQQHAEWKTAHAQLIQFKYEISGQVKQARAKKDQEKQDHAASQKLMKQVLQAKKTTKVPPKKCGTPATVEEESVNSNNQQNGPPKLCTD